MLTKPARKDRLAELRKEIAARFGTDAATMPRIAAYGKERKYPAYQVYTIQECEKALASGVLPDPNTIAAMSKTRPATVPQVPTVDTVNENKPRVPVNTIHHSTALYCEHDIDAAVCPFCTQFQRDAAKRRAAINDRVIDESENSVPVDTHDDETNGDDNTMQAENNGHAVIDEDAQQLAEIMARLSRKNPGAMDEARVREIVAELLKEAGGGKQVLTVKIGELPSVDINGQHQTFPLLLAVLAARVPVMMAGPAGSGKTSAAHAAATALNLPFYCMSVGPQTSKSDFKGYQDANGNYHRTPLREAYENGGVFLLDEIDAGNPGVITELNAALANSGYTFADGQYIVRHADFIPVAAANTFGTGADRQYVGRNQLDAATIDRFFMLEWGYDEAFEASLIGIKRARVYQTPSNSGMSGEEWYTFVTGVRAAISACGVRHIVSPRATIYGARLLEIIGRETLEEGLIWKGLKRETRDQVRNAMKGGK